MSLRFRSAVRLTTFAALAFVAVSCSEKAPPPPPPQPAAPVQPPPDPPAPDAFDAKFETSKGTFVVHLDRTWSPRGVDRFYRLVNEGYFKDVRFFRVLKGFVAQFGMAPDPAVNAKYDSLRIQDDPVTHSNKRGTIVFATAGANTRSNQFFINFSDNANLDGMGFSPLGEVKSGMAVVDKLYNAYGEGAPQGPGPSQDSIRVLGNAYLTRAFPKLDYIKTVTIEK